MKQAKITTLILVVIALTTALVNTQCSKKEKMSSNSTQKQNPNANGGDPTAFRTMEDIELPDDASDEMVRIYNDVKNGDYEVAIIANSNFGSFSSSRTEDTYLCGYTQPGDDISITLNGNSFSPDGNGQWMTLNESWPAYYDKDVNVKIKTGSTLLKEANIHVPAPHKAAKLGDGMTIERTGNTLTWTADDDNTTGNIILYYYLYDADGAIIDIDGAMIEDDGSYSLDDILSNTNAKSIYFQLISGNTVSTEINGEGILFYIETVDHHEYSIAD